MRISRQSIYYLLAMIGLNGILWGLCLAYLGLAPVKYNSDFTLILPLKNSKTVANFEGVGNVASTGDSVYGTDLADPRSDYIYIIGSSSFLSTVAESLNISEGELGVPRMKAVDNSSILRVEVKGTSPEDAQSKAQAIYDQFLLRVNQLRQQEEELRTRASENNLGTTSENLKKAQEKLVRFQKESGFNSPKQIDLLAETIESIRRNKALVDAELSAVTKNFQELSAILNLTPTQAADAFTLKADELFQKTRQEYDDASSKLAILTEKLDENHPDVIRESARVQGAKRKLNERGKELVGEYFDVSLIGLLNLNEGDPVGRKSLYEQLISLDAQKSSLEANSQELERKLNDFNDLYIQQIQYRERYENLTRDLRIAEILFSSNVANTEVGDGNNFDSYPLFQLLNPPSVPSEPSSPKTKFALLGGGLGSILVSLAIGLLWFRAVKQGKKQKMITEKEEKPTEENQDSYIISDQQVNSYATEEKFKVREN